MISDLVLAQNQLMAHGAINPCHRCGKGAFSVTKEFTNIILQTDLEAGLVVGGPSIPAVLVICKNCGAITFHALGALGLLPDKKGGDK